MRPKYNKPPLSLSNQLRHLENLGLEIGDFAHVEKFLDRVGYYRFNGYAFPLKDNLTGRFRKGVTFSQIKEIYTFDRTLKLHVFDAIERIEVALRSRLVNTLSNSYGSRWYEDAALFYNSQNYSKNLEEVYRSIHRAREQFILYYRAKRIMMLIMLHRYGWRLKR